MDIVAILVAALGGLLIGAERERSGKTIGVNARFGGIRTFTLLGGIAGLAGMLARLHLAGPGIVLMAGAVAIVVAGYAAASRRDVDATTEVAALVVIAAGVVSGLGYLAPASGVIAITAVLLIEKGRLHAAVARVDDEELRAAARFAVMALVVLPILPEGPIDSLGGIKPRELWTLVLFFSGLSFVGYIARKVLGARLGYPIAGLFGGLVSSTNVTLTFARLSRKEPAHSSALAFGVIGACTILVPRVLLATTILDRAVAVAVLPYLAPAFAAGAIALVAGLLLQRDGAATEDTVRNPLQLMSALQMVVAFQLVLFAVRYVGQWFGDAGFVASGAVLGLTDVDALTVSMTRAARDGGTTAAVAATAIAVGILANTVFKTAIAAALGSPAFRRIAPVVLAAMGAAIGIMLGFRAG